LDDAKLHFFFHSHNDYILFNISLPRRAGHNVQGDNALQPFPPAAGFRGPGPSDRRKRRRGAGFLHIIGRLAAASEQSLRRLVAGCVRAVLFAVLSPFVLRLFFVLKTEYNRRTNEEQTAKNTARGKGAEKAGPLRGK